MGNTEKTKLVEFFNCLIGEKCWSVIAGPGGGSMISMTFGRPIKRKWPLKNSMLSESVRSFEGELKMFVQNSDWQLEFLGDIVCDNFSDNSLGGPMVVGLENLVGTKVTSVSFIDKVYSVQIKFSNKFSLKVFCVENVGDEISNYTVFDPGRCIAVLACGKLCVEHV